MLIRFVSEVIDVDRVASSRRALMDGILSVAARCGLLVDAARNAQGP